MEWNNRILITGTSGTGKSWFRDYIIRSYIKYKKRRFFVVIDDRKNNAKTLYQKEKFFIQEYNRMMVHKNYNWRKFIKYHEKIYIIPTNVNQEEIQRLINNIILALWDLTDGLLVIDEAHQFLKTGKYEPGEMKRFVRGGRKDGLDSLVVTHRVVDLSPDLVSLFNRLITFRVTEKNSLERLNPYHDQFYSASKKLIDPGLKGKERKEVEKLFTYKKPENFIKNLPNRVFLYSDTENGIQEISSSNIAKI